MGLNPHLLEMAKSWVKEAQQTGPSPMQQPVGQVPPAGTPPPTNATPARPAGTEQFGSTQSPTAEQTHQQPMQHTAMPPPQELTNVWRQRAVEGLGAQEGGGGEGEGGGG